MGQLRLRRGGLRFRGAASRFGVESAGFHCGDRFRILHEGLPNERRAEVLGHQQADSKVNAKNIGVIPMEFGVEGIAESVASPRVFAVLISKRAQNMNAVARKKRQ